MLQSVRRNLVPPLIISYTFSLSVRNDPQLPMLSICTATNSNLRRLGLYSIITRNLFAYYKSYGDRERLGCVPQIEILKM